MLIIGLTGSIATGKSTVSALLSQPPHSLPIVDADKLARTVVAPGTRAYNQIVAHFSPTTPDLLLPAPSDASTPSGEKASNPSGENASSAGRPLDRAALGRRIFGSAPEKAADRAVLNGIVHPAVRRAMVRAVLGEYVRGSRAVVLDVPLLFESGLDVFCGVTVVVGVRDKEVQLRRLLSRDKEAGGTLTEEEARGRIESQGDVRWKVERCRERGEGWADVVWNDGGRDELRLKVASVVRSIEDRSPGWWQSLMWAFPPLALVLAIYGMWYGRQARVRFGERKNVEKAKL